MNIAASNDRKTSHGFFKNWKSVVPIAEWLPDYNKKFLGMDLVAGMTLASFVLPESMAYATLAGLPVQTGIYCCMAGGLLYAIFTSSKHLAVGPTSAISLMVGTTIASMAGGDPSRWLAIAELTALVVGVICLAAFLLKLSSLVSFISESILLGFKAGAALSIMSTQLPKFFGVEGGGGHFFERIGILIQHLPHTNPVVLIFGSIALLLLILGDKIFPGKPVSLVVVILSILTVTFLPFLKSHLHITGDIPGGLPSIGRPSLRLSDVDGVIELAFACFLMGYIETVSAARTFALKNNYEVNPRQELLSLGAGNIAAALASGYPVAGGLSQSTVNEKSGAKTPLSLIICSVTLAILLLFCTSLLYDLPEVLLAVIVLHAVSGLIKVQDLKLLYGLSRMEFLVAMIALAGVLIFGILKGVMIAAILSLAFLIRKLASPNVAVLGRIGNTDRYSDVERHPDNVQLKDILILRVEASLLYFNVEHIRDQFDRMIQAAGKNVKLVVLDMSASPYVDVAGSKMLLQLSRNLAGKGIHFKIVEALAGVRDMLRKQGMEQLVGHISRKTSINDAVNEQTLPSAS
jgi:high affinity sulfate transporter 1